LKFEEGANQYVKDNIFGIVAGWGRTKDGEPSETLQSVNLRTVSHENCNKKLSKQDSIDPDKFCVDLSSGKNVCPGDSGGGFVVLDSKTDRHFLWGIVSHGIKKQGVEDVQKCDENFVTTFTNIQYFKGEVVRALVNLEGES
jgi:secreted trypsin-like serine protease